MEVELPTIGIVKFERTTNEDYEYEAYLWGINFNNQKIDFDFHLNNAGQIDDIKTVLNDVQKLIEDLIKYYKYDFTEEGTTYEFIEEWIEILEDEEKGKILKEGLSLNQSLLELLRIVRIGIYKGNSETQITFDFALGYDDDNGYREHMLVLKMDNSYNIVEITTEG